MHRNNAYANMNIICFNINCSNYSVHCVEIIKYLKILGSIMTQLITLTDSMEKSSSSEPKSHLISQEIPHLLWNPKVHYRVPKSLPLVPILNQMHPVHIYSPYFRKILCNVIFPSTSASSK